jgi:putative PIN family toxin of toxin-antitoxin system
MRVVLGTNVLVSAVLIAAGNENRVLQAWQRGLFDLVVSPSILEELARVLSYEKIRKAGWMTERELAPLLEALAAESITVGAVAVKASRDPEDDKSLAAAIERGAEYLVSGDRDLLALEAYRNVRIVRPARFLSILRESEQGPTSGGGTGHSSIK